MSPTLIRWSIGGVVLIFAWLPNPRMTMIMTAASSSSRRWLLLLAAVVVVVVQGHIEDHRYNLGDHVELWVNKVRDNRRLPYGLFPRVVGRNDDGPESIPPQILTPSSFFLLLFLIHSLPARPSPGRSVRQSPRSV
jgi:hypothetical protein